MHPDMKLVGRAVTLQFMPQRPDVQAPSDPNTGSSGPRIQQHQRFIDALQPGDVAVVDLGARLQAARDVVFGDRGVSTSYRRN
jgi:4-hydroxy-4-methyl-2-oxoglutarate aldolase